MAGRFPLVDQGDSWTQLPSLQMTSGSAIQGWLEQTLGATLTNLSSHQELRASAQCTCADELIQFVLYKPSTCLQHLETRFQSYSTGFC